MTINQSLRNAQNILNENHVPNAEYDAFALFEYVTGYDKSQYIMRANEEMPDDKQRQFEELIAKRAKRIPLQHLTGNQNFFGYDFIVSSDVLVPRQDTEVLVSEVLSISSDYTYPIRILDLCTGSGCIGVTLYLELNKAYGKCDITATDISDKALDIARKNAEKLIGNSNDFHIIKSDLFDALDSSNKYDIIVSNPPYIPTSDIERLDTEVREHDPRMALDGGDDGLDFYKRIVDSATHFLEDGGQLVMEMGYNQGDDISAVMTDNGYSDIRIIKDLAGLDRVIGGYYVR